MPDKGGMSRACVVIGYWAGRPAKNVLRLLAEMDRIDAGCPFSTYVVVNGGDVKPLTLPARFEDVRVINRENTGYNITAWDVGWRAAAADGFDHFLFLQDECFLKQARWLSEYVFRMSEDAGIGLLGEAIMWDQMSWAYIRTATDRDLGAKAWPKDEAVHPLDFYQSYLDRLGIPRTGVGTHLQSIVLFSSKAVLEEVGGFPHPTTYREAVGCEIGISRLIASRGYRIAKVKDRPFDLIGHHQWTRRAELVKRWRGRASAVLRRIGLKK
jgi:hypothetical protein